jgi:DNA primase
LDADAQAVLDAAVELYANRLLIDDAALAYMARRGFPRELLERERVGYAAGDELVRYLLWRRLPLDTARRVGLLRADGREYLAERVIFPEIRAGHAVWLIGRVLDTPAREKTSAGPRYLGLPGQKPLLGWEAANRDLRGVCLVEGPMDVRLVPSKLMLHSHQGMRG